MKGILEFQLPEESTEFDDARHGTQFKCMLDQIDYRIMRILRGKEDLPGSLSPELDDTQARTLEAVQYIIVDELENHDLTRENLE